MTSDFWKVDLGRPGWTCEYMTNWLKNNDVFISYTIFVSHQCLIKGWDLHKLLGLSYHFHSPLLSSYGSVLPPLTSNIREMAYLHLWVGLWERWNCGWLLVQSAETADCDVTDLWWSCCRVVASLVGRWVYLTTWVALVPGGLIKVNTSRPASIKLALVFGVTDRGKHRFGRSCPWVLDLCESTHSCITAFCISFIVSPEKLSTRYFWNHAELYLAMDSVSERAHTRRQYSTLFWVGEKRFPN